MFILQALIASILILFASARLSPTLAYLRLFALYREELFSPYTHTSEIAFINSFVVDINELIVNNMTLIRHLPEYPLFCSNMLVTLENSTQSRVDRGDMLDRYSASLLSIQALSKEWSTLKERFKSVLESYPETSAMIAAFVQTLNYLKSENTVRARKYSNESAFKTYHLRFGKLIGETFDTITHPNTFARLAVEAVVDVHILLSALHVPLKWLAVGLGGINHLHDGNEVFQHENRFGYYVWRWQMALKDITKL